MGQWINGLPLLLQVLLLTNRTLLETNSLHYPWIRVLFIKRFNWFYWPLFIFDNNSPSLLEISELCIFGLSCAILRRCNRDQTMNAFIGRLMCCSSACRFVVVWLIRLQKRLSREKRRAWFKLSIDDVDQIYGAAHLVLFELFMMWWCPFWAVVYREAAAAAAAATEDVDGLLWSADGVCSPRELREEWPEWLFSACWLRECEDKESPGRARDGSLSIILLTPSRSWEEQTLISSVNSDGRSAVQLIVQLTSTKRRWTERYCASSFSYSAPTTSG